MHLFVFLLKSSGRLVALAVLAGLVSALSGVALLAVVHQELGRDPVGSTALAAAFIGLCLLSAVTRVLAQAMMVRLGQDSVSRLWLHLCRRLLGLSLERFEQVDRASVFAALTEDIAVITGALVGVPLLGINIPIIVACLIYVGWLSAAVLAVGLLFVVLGIAIYFAVAAKGLRWLRQARQAQDQVVGYARGLVEGFRELKQSRSRRAAFVADCLEPASYRVRERASVGLGYFALAEGWSQVAFFAFIGLVLFVVPRIQPVDRQTLAGAVLVVLYLNSPLDVLVTWLPAVGRAQASLAKIEALLPALGNARLEEREMPAAQLPHTTLRESLQLDALTYAYPPEPDGTGFRLGPIDFTLRPGELVFVAGGNGSGKTTFVKLLAGLYRGHEGTIRVDGQPVGAAEIPAYRELFSVVFADGYLFRELLGLDQADLEAQAQEGLARLGLDRLVQVEQRAFSNLDLSMGQKRRLALLAAWLENRPVYIFDEWAAHQDRTFKRFFYRELLPELKAQGKAIIVISHDDEYYDAADRILRLQGGAAVETVELLIKEG